MVHKKQIYSHDFIPRPDAAGVLTYVFRQIAKAERMAAFGIAGVQVYYVPSSPSHSSAPRTQRPVSLPTTDTGLHNSGDDDESA